MIHKGGVGFVEGVELYRMGQTNVLGRYPIHFHQLRECPECYFKESSVHRSYYRCISIHATNSTTVSENVAYDIIGYCYYLEDGVETKNMFAFNMAAHIHMILPDQPPTSDSHLIDVYKQSDELTLPADVTAGGFYITNLDNNFIGNSVSGGWSGYVIVNLPAPVGRSQEIPIRPFLAAGMIFDGNIAHSTSWWWENAGALYIGGSLFFDENDVLSFNAGRDLNLTRDPCKTHTPGPCAPKDQLWMKFTNTKVYLTPAAAIQSWTGRLEVVGYETHDVGRALNIYANDFWVDNMLAVCRTGEPIALPPSAATTRIPGNGFEWTDTEHIVTNSTFRRCGYRSADFAQYDNGLDRGCGDDNLTGCSPTSAVFNFFAQSDRNNPDLMQASSEIVMEDCGRRFRLGDFGDGTLPSTVSSRIQNWIDVDGSVTGFNEHSLIVSGLEDCGLWWSVDDNVVDDVQGPLKFIKTSEGPERGLGHIHLEWNDGLHAEVGKSLCGHVNTDPCPAVGSIRHLGPRFANDPGLPVTASADIIGPVGGYGWLLELDGGAPRKMTLSQVEVDPATPLLLSVAYPLGTMFRITASAPAWCSLLEDARYSCSKQFSPVSSIQEVRDSTGNTYHVSPDGVLTLRVIQSPADFVGKPDWFLPTWEDVDRSGEWYALDRFERKGVRLPRTRLTANVDSLGLSNLPVGVKIEVEASCCFRGDDCSGPYCDGLGSSRQVDTICPSGFDQVSYDKCCNRINLSDCIYANGERTS